jgi:squalene synthase HpnC
MNESSNWWASMADGLPKDGPVNLAAARKYCRRIARGHYENFIVGSVLVPRRLIQHLYNIYAFCRQSDDLADETGDSAKSRELLDAWKSELALCYSGTPTHPIMIALQDTIRVFDIPIDPFEDLISAFVQDCTVTRYRTYDEVLDYCTRSANPVGRIFLWVFGHRDVQRHELSDKICTALQLANFWQDVARDWEKGRVYIPLEDIEAFGCRESDIADRRITPQFKALIRFEVERAQALFDEGAVLPRIVNRRLGVDLELFRRGGMAVLEGIRKNDYDVLTSRPEVSKSQQIRLFFESVRRVMQRTKEGE